MSLPNVIIIIVDTLRKDYASSLEITLKNFGFIRYEEGIAPAPWTTPSHASIFTGVYPAIHGAHEGKHKKAFDVKLVKNEDILSIQLSNWKYRTFLLSANPYINPSFGFTGFDHFYEISHIPSSVFPLLSNEIKKLERLKQEYNTKDVFEVIKALIGNREYKLLSKISLNYFTDKPHQYIHSKVTKWPLDKGANTIIKMVKNLKIMAPEIPKFIFINLMEVHEPYRRNERHPLMDNLKTNKLNQDVVKYWQHRYVKEVRYVTKKLTELITALKEKNIFDNSLIIVTSDHGQLLGEHGRIGHGTFLYDELLRIPLLIKYPKDCSIKQAKLQNKYISLVGLKSFIPNIIKNKVDSDAMLYSDVAFAECYGIQHSIFNLLSEKERKNIECLEKYRIAIYYNNFKGIFNITDWRFESIKACDPNVEVTRDAINDIKKYLMKFIKVAYPTKNIRK